MCLPPRDEVAKTGSSQPNSNTHTTVPQPFRRRFPTLPLQRRATVEVVEDFHGVTFQDEDQVHQVPTTLSCLGADQSRNELWYSSEDIREFRKQAQVLSKRPPHHHHEESEDDCTRGLELRMSLQRQDRKQQIVKRILDAQDDDCTAEEISQIASQHSLWARKLAMAQAHKDYYAAYHPNLTSVLPEMPSLLDCSRETNKRSLLEQPTGRRVRCRMF